MLSADHVTSGRIGRMALGSYRRCFLALAGVLLFGLFGALLSDVSGAKRVSSLKVGFPSTSFSASGAKVTAEGKVRVRVPKRAVRVASPKSLKRLRFGWTVVLEEKKAKGRWVPRVTRKLKLKGTRLGSRTLRFNLTWSARRGPVTVRVSVRHRKKIVGHSRVKYLVLSRPAESPPVGQVTPEEIVSLPSDGTNEVVLEGEPVVPVGGFLASSASSVDPEKIFLLKVVAVKKEDGKTVYKTKPGSIFEAVPSGSFDVKIGEESLRASSSTKRLAAQKGTYKLACESGVSGTYTASFSRSLAFEASFEWASGIRGWAPPKPFFEIEDSYLKAVATIGASAAAELNPDPQVPSLGVLASPSCAEFEDRASPVLTEPTPTTITPPLEKVSLKTD